jgi:hypothetical protein
MYLLSHTRLSAFSLTDHTPTQYHRYCRDHPSVRCLYDDRYFCLCQARSRRAECFVYDNKQGECTLCHSQGRCIQGSGEAFKCLCQPCYFGTQCQLHFEAFSFTVDQLFLFDLLSENVLIRSMTLCSIIIIPSMFFAVGFATNLFSFVTFRRRRGRRNGIDEYLLFMSIFNQINLLLLLLCVIHMLISVVLPYSSIVLDKVLCKSLNYLLTNSNRLSYWLISLISIERFYIVLRVQGRWLKKPSVARRILLMLFVLMAMMSAYEVVFFDAVVSFDHAKHPMCILKIPVDSDRWRSWHEFASVFQGLTPFLINIVCTMGIIYRVTQKKISKTEGGKLGKVTTNTINENIENSSESKRCK